jgi:hypothetical protein
MVRDQMGVEIEYALQVSAWTQIHRADIVMMQRPHTKEHSQYAQNVKLANRKLWVDFDDDYLHVPDSNPAHAFFTDPQNNRWFKIALALADAVTVSTHALKEVYQPFSKVPIQVLSNGYDSQLFGYHTGIFEKRRPIIWMRGGNSHDGDALTWSKQIVSAVVSHDDYRFVCYGFTPWPIVNELRPNTWSVRERPMMQYFHESYSMNPAVMVVPLENNAFNRSKSNVAAIEGTMTGSIVVAPAFLPEFESLPGAILYDERPQSLKDALVYALSIAGSESGFAHVMKMRHHILTHLELGSLNNKRDDLVQSLVRP